VAISIPCQRIEPPAARLPEFRDHLAILHRPRQLALSGSNGTGFGAPLATGPARRRTLDRLAQVAINFSSEAACERMRSISLPRVLIFASMALTARARCCCELCSDATRCCRCCSSASSRAFSSAIFSRTS
jgi:hypothetical protein